MATGPYQLLDALPAPVYAALREDIRQRGVLVPVEVDQDGQILDGHHRAAIAAELGIDYPTIVRSFTSEQEKREHVLKVNLLRRQLDSVAWAKLFRQLLDERNVRLGQGTRNDLTCRTVRQVDPGEDADVRGSTVRTLATELGVDHSTAYRRLNHADAAEKYPEIAALPASVDKQIKMAASLDALPEDERCAALGRLRNRDTAAVDTMSDLLGQPRVDYERARRVKAELAGQSRWSTALTSLSVAMAEVEAAGGINALRSGWPPDALAQYATQLADAIDRLTAWHAALTNGE